MVVASGAPVAAGAAAIMGMAIRVAMAAAIAPVRGWRDFVGTCPVLPSIVDRTRSWRCLWERSQNLVCAIALHRSSPSAITRRDRVDTAGYAAVTSTRLSWYTAPPPMSESRPATVALALTLPAGGMAPGSLVGGA